MFFSIGDTNVCKRVLKANFRNSISIAFEVLFDGFQLKILLFFGFSTFFFHSFCDLSSWQLELNVKSGALKDYITMV